MTNGSGSHEPKGSSNDSDKKTTQSQPKEKPAK
ncbi:hypothetical protein Poly59_22350 [Rubripirellula reticaptiva]|uniref:Uncharacterized protein n=1 Tax=Rubripirellula reticaptiva TaxID=2528013 RepID=A0A5C6F499_9BACT|nr:hypothetical protein Poly59_22350 [Rubripirellula reticaptiva]